MDVSKNILKGNRKTQVELRFTVECSCLINRDSEFDLEHIATSAIDAGKKAKVLIRINTDVDPQVHSYTNTDLVSCKFGIRN